MGEYTYLDDLPEGESGDFGTAAYRDVGTEGDEVPDNDILDTRLAEVSGGGGGVITAFRFITSSNNFTTASSTTKIFFILIGGGAGGSAPVTAYDSDLQMVVESSYGGGAGGVTVGLAAVAGGVSLSVTIGQGGAGGDSGASDDSLGGPRYGSSGSSSVFIGYTSRGGGLDVYSTALGENIMYARMGGIGSTSDDEDILWAKQGGNGIQGNLDVYDVGDDHFGGLGGSPWAGRAGEWAFENIGESTDDLHYSYRYSFWRSVMQGMTARYGHGGAGAEASGVDGYPGGDGALIAVELA